MIDDSVRRWNIHGLAPRTLYDTTEAEDANLYAANGQLSPCLGVGEGSLGDVVVNVRRVRCAHRSRRPSGAGKSDSLERLNVGPGPLLSANPDSILS